MLCKAFLLYSFIDFVNLFCFFYLVYFLFLNFFLFSQRQFSLLCITTILFSFSTIFLFLFYLLRQDFSNFDNILFSFYLLRQYSFLTVSIFFYFHDFFNTVIFFLRLKTHSYITLKQFHGSIY